MAKRELDQKQERQIGLFDMINDISSSKQYIFNDDTAQVYLPFMVNKALSQHLDTILLANEMNKHNALTKEMHHDFLFYSVDAKPRYGKWAKAEKQNEGLIAYVKDKYDIGNERAIEYIKLMTETDIQQIEVTLKKKGGMK